MKSFFDCMGAFVIIAISNPGAKSTIDLDRNDKIAIRTIFPTVRRLVKDAPPQDIHGAYKISPYKIILVQYNEKW